MSLKKVHNDQPKEFKFSDENLNSKEIKISLGLTSLRY